MREKVLKNAAYAAVLLLLVAACNVYAQDNLIVNGGFVGDAVPLGWSMSGTSVAMDNYSGSTRSSDGDGWYSKLGLGGATADGILYQQVAVEAGKLHSFSFDHMLLGYYNENVCVDIFDGAVDGSDTATNPISGGDLVSETVAVDNNVVFTQSGGTFTPTQSTVTFRISDIGTPVSVNACALADNVKLAATYVPEVSVPVTFDAVADAEIDQHVNYNNSNLGKATSIRVETRDPAYTNPVESPQSWALMKWNLDSIDPSTVLGDASVRIIQCDGSVDTVDVYAIDEGDWDELSVTWNNWVGTETVEYLGTMTNTAYPDGVSTFSSSALTAWVQDWIDGDQENYGLLFKWSGSVSDGDTYVSREHASLDPPQLIITAVPEPGTIVLLLGGLCLVLFIKNRR